MSKIVFLIIIHLGGVYGLDSARLASDFKSDGIKLTIKKVRYLPDDTGLYELKDIKRKLFILRMRLKKVNKTVATHYLIAPLYKDGVPYIAGLSTAGCFKDIDYAASMSIWLDYNLAGADRREHSYQACRHEVCHNLGCVHINNPVNIMLPDPLPLVGVQELPFLRQSIRQMRACANEL